MRKPPRARVKTLALIAIIAAYPLQFIAAMLGSLGLLFTGSDDLILMMLFANLILIAVSMVIIQQFKHLTQRRLDRGLIQPAPPRVAALSTKSFVIAASIYTILALLAGQGIAQWLMTNSDSTSTTTEAFAATSPLILLLSIVIVGPIAEEALYRGALFQIMRSAFSAPFTIAVTAIIFGLSHGSVIQTIVTLPMGIAVAVIAERTGSFVVPALVHIGYNAIAVYPPPFLVDFLSVGWVAVIGTIAFIAVSITLVVIKARRPQATTL